MSKIDIIDNFSNIENLSNVVDLIQDQFKTYGVTKKAEEIIKSLENALSFKSRSVLFLMKDEADIAIGFSFGNICSGLESGGDYLWLNELFISECYRNKGLGKTLVTFIETWCLEKDIRYISCSTGVKNVKAQTFYKSMAYDLSEIFWVDKSI